MKKAELKKLKALNGNLKSAYDMIEGLSYEFEMALTDDEATDFFAALNTLGEARKELTRMVEK
jgi:hypothetical protein